MKNQPYVKQYGEDANGITIVTNPITKENPFLNIAPSNRGNNKKSRFMGNTSGAKLVVGQKFKYRKSIQVIGTKRIEHYILS